VLSKACNYVGFYESDGDEVRGPREYRVSDHFESATVSRRRQEPTRAH